MNSTQHPPPPSRLSPELPVDYTAFLGRSSTLEPEYLESPSAAEHLPLLFWLVELLEPSLAVDLGASDASHFFAVCQVAETLSLDTKAVLGAPNLAPADDSEKLESWLGHLNDRHAMRSRFIGGDAASAAATLTDNSVDLLILHASSATAEQVSEWAALMEPKLSPRGIIFIDGIGDDVAGTLASIAPAGQSVRFLQGDGCAIVTAGPNTAPQIRYLFALSADEPALSTVAALFKRLGLACRHSAALKELQSTNKELHSCRESLTIAHEELGLRAARLVAREAEILELRERCEWLREEALDATRRLHAANQSLAASKQLELELREAKRRIRNLLGDRGSFRDRLTAMLAENESLRSELQTILQSRSWRTTAPVRKALHRLRILLRRPALR